MANSSFRSRLGFYMSEQLTCRVLCHGESDVLQLVQDSSSDCSERLRKLHHVFAPRAEQHHHREKISIVCQSGRSASWSQCFLQHLGVGSAVGLVLPTVALRQLHELPVPVAHHACGPAVLCARRCCGDIEPPVFGKPMAPSAIWEGYKEDARDRFMAEMNNSDGDSVLAALYLAAEDDAVQTRSTVELPTASFSKRLDTLVASARGSLQASQPLPPHQAVEQIPELLFGGMGFRTAKQSLELYSPYRIYMHKVLTQRCGTPEALGALLAAFMVRLQRAGLVEKFPVELGLAGPGVAPSARVAEASQREQGELSIRWRTGLQCVAECLSQLKRTNWSWDWYTGNPDSFELPAEAFLGSFGRANVGSAVVGVMQATGRPFGDLDLALLDCQRLACVAATEREQMRNVRDQGVLLCHLQRYPDAQAALERYEQWVAAHPEFVAGSDAAPSAESLIQQRELQLIHDVKLKLAQLSLEAAYSSS